jgi:DnaK suppressor protein
MILETDKQELRKLLLDEKQRVETELHSFAIETKSSPGGHEVFLSKKEREGNPEDQAGQEEQYYRLKSLEKIFEQRLNEINQALDRINDSGFGICQNCKEEIPMERLKVNPAATTCIKCVN